MRKIQLKREAVRDLDSILIYTEKRYGRTQRKKYSKQIESRLKDLAKNPSLGRSCEHVLPGYRYYLEGKHYLFYKQDKSTLTVIRILHSRMDYQRILSDDSK